MSSNMETIIIDGQERRIFSDLPMAVYWLEQNHILVEFKQTIDEAREYKTEGGQKIIVKPARFCELFPNLYDNDGHIINEN